MTPNLSGLTIGSLALSPSFDANVTAYTATTSNASNKVTATVADGLTVALTLNGDAFTNETSASWDAGENEIVITVTNSASQSKTYTVTVTKE